TVLSALSCPACSRQIPIFPSIPVVAASMSRPPPPFTPQNPTPAPRPGGQSPSSTLPASFSNLQISRAPPPFASVGPPQGDGPVPSSIRGPQAPPPGARPFPGSPSPPGSLFACPAPSVQQSPPFGAPPAAQSLQQQRPPFNGPPPVLPAQVQRAPFGGPPAASQPLPYGGPPAAVSQLAPFGVSPVAAAQSAPLGAPRYSAAQPPQFSGLSGAVSRPSYSGGSIPPFGAARAPSQQGPYGGPPQFGGERPGLQTPLFGAQTAPASQPPPFMGVRGANAPAFGPPGWQGQTRPAASSEFIVKDTGNCSPRLMRCTMNQIPCTGDLLTTSGMPLAIMVQPFALPHPSEEAIQLVDFGEMGPIRCSRCKAYINPFMRFVDQGKIFICNLCGFSNDTPREYLCNLGPDGRRRDADDRPELCRGTVEFIATKEFLVREPMPAVYFFLVDVSMNAIQTGATAAACSAISQSLSDLPVPERWLGLRHSILLFTSIV
uniref:Zinc finger Sec23/Sec24-type domain-containing protein n=1 Tax=Aegilops tauschii subsp. strangulata TaxID=200361 RepID=A0A453K584_AEGTS